MSADPILTCTTNTRPGSVSEQTFGCEILWAWGQQEAIRRLTVEKRDPYSQHVHSELVASFSARAARIAATYARFYLELEDGGKPELKGRFYWMGLAAFASKQVKCGLDFIPDALAVSVGDYLPNPMAIGKDGLGWAKAIFGCSRTFLSGIGFTVNFPNSSKSVRWNVMH